MARFYGRIGYGESVEVLDSEDKGTGIWVDSIVERNYYGDVIRNTRTLREGEGLNFDLSVQNSISIVADAYANEHFLAFSYDWGRCIMGQRLKLQRLLETITEKVYFQPPTNVKLVYPCIIYRRDSANTEFADNAPYSTKKRYTVTVIDRDPDSVIPDKVAALPACRFDRFYTVDNLNHDVFSIYF